MQEITDRLQRIEEGLDKLREYLVSADTKNAARRKEYRAAKAKRDEGKVPLPDRHVLRYRDKRIQHRVRAWAEAGMRFGHANQPEKFCAWFVYEWNNTCYLKKPVTFSGSSFRVWVDHLRCSYGPLDLMGYAKRRDRVQVLRNDGEYDDFQKRPWWDWGYAVLMPVFKAMQANPGFGELPVRFVRCLRLLLSGYGELEVYTELYWDPNETRDNLNKMLRRVGIDLQMMMQACWSGLRVKGENPITVP